jgi:hypothetical protein
MLIRGKRYLCIILFKKSIPCGFFLALDKLVDCSLQLLGETLPYDKQQDVRQRMCEIAPNLLRVGDCEGSNFYKQALDVAMVCVLMARILNVLLMHLL